MLFLLLVSIVNAEICEVDRIKQVLKKILFLYYTEPDSVPLTKDEVKDVLVFYLSINDQNITIDCSAFGSRSNRQISDVVNAGENVADKIPACADGTKYGECSKSRPAYCYAGAIYQKCGLCGCPTNSVCGKSDKCSTTAQNITCFKDIDCGQTSFIGNYYCLNNYIYKNYINYTCLNPGTSSSGCAVINGTYILAYCNPNLNQSCVEGQSYCKVPVTNVSTSNNSTITTNTTINQTINQTSFDTITVKGRYINKFTGQPLSNIGFWLLKSPSTNLGTFYTDSNGYFSVTMSATDITETVYKVLAHLANCYISDNGIVISRYPISQGGAPYVWINYFDMSGNIKYFSITSSEINIGDVPLWPSADFSLSSDTPVKLDILYPEEGRGVGNTNYLTSHYLKNVIPLNYNVRAQLTDSTGNIYFSPYTNVPLNNGCTPVNLNFFNKQFAWNSTTTQINTTNQTSTNQTTPTGICLIRDLYTSVPVFSAPDFGKGYAKISKSGVNTISGLQNACSQSDYSSLLTAYCMQNSNQIQQQVMTYDSQGNYQSLSCGAFGCNYVSCPGANQTNQTIQLPDLTVLDMITYLGNPTYSGNTYINITVKNIGTATAGNSMARFDSTGQGSNYWRIGTSSIAPSSIEILTFATNFSAGTYTFTATADVDNTISELNENNNVLVKSVIVTSSTNQTTVTNQTNVSFKCSDSDYGLNYYLYGTTNGYKAFWEKISSNIVTEKDSCTYICSGSVGSGINTSGPCLIEYYCDSNDYAAFNVNQCPYGCSNGACLNQTTNQSASTPTGVCLIRDSYTSVPLFSDSDIGKGYAKAAKPGVNTISGLQSACSQSDYSALLQSYCTSNSNSIQQQVMTYDSTGHWSSLSCGAFGCNYVSC